MSLAVVGERALWLGLSGLSGREFLDVPVELKALFGAAVTNMYQQCDLCKKDGEAFEMCLPKKPTAYSTHKVTVAPFFTVQESCSPL